MKSVYLLIIFILGITCNGQEICDNSVDDDGDTLIDLNDPECVCSQLNVESIIPNSSFEENIGCPASFTELYLCTGWVQATSASTDYLNTCGFVFDAINTAGLTPFPDGNGIIGAIFGTDYKEYLGSCLNSPLEANENYQLTFYIASLPFAGDGSVCGDGQVYYEPTEITLYGTESCGNLPLFTSVDPASASNSWFIVGSVFYEPQTFWSQVTINFTPDVDINAIILGAPPTLPQAYEDILVCYPYFLFDDLVLNESALFGANIGETGNFCAGDLVLTADITSEISDDAVYQWYLAGVAVPGATSPTYIVPANNDSLGSYTLQITDNNSCFLTSAYLITTALPGPQTTFTAPTCIDGGTITVTTSADQYSFDNGATWVGTNTISDLDPGTYYVKIKYDSGCVSTGAAVELPIPLYLDPPEVATIFATCGPTGSIIVITPASAYSFDGGDTWTTNPILNNLVAGTYEVRIRDSSGCMSFINTTYIGQDYIPDPSYTTVDPGCSNDDGTITIDTVAELYSFDGGSTWTTSNTTTGLAAGLYLIAIQDADGCVSFPLAVFLTQPYLPPPEYTFENPDCTGANGTITFTTIEDFYSIDEGYTWTISPNFTGLPEGDYLLRTKNNEGCISELSFVSLTTANPAAPSYTYLPPDCNQSGSITIETVATEYSFDGGDTWTTNNILEDLSTNEAYIIMVRTAVDCESDMVEINVGPPPTIPDVPEVFVTQPSCISPEGSITITSTANEYSFDNGVTWSIANDSGPLPEGTYFVVARNTPGCESAATEIAIAEPVEIPDAPEVTVTEPTCIVSTGIISVTTTSTFYSFDNGASWDTSNNSGPLPAGTYLVKIINGSGCDSPATEVVIAGTEIDAPLATVTQPDCQVATGSITVTTAANQYSFDNGTSWVSTNLQTGLPPGTYYVMIKDEEGCISFATEVVIAPVDAVPLPNVTDAAYCQGDTPTALTATGTNLLWYDSPAGGIGSSVAPIPSTAEGGITTYYVSQTLNGCESGRAAITVTVWPTPQPPAGDDLEYCQGDTTNALTATGTNLLWYDAPAGGTGTATPPLPSSQSPGTFVHYVSQTTNGCESDRTAINVLINPVPDAPQTEAVITYEHMDITVDLTAMGTNLTWYDSDMDMLNSAPIPSSEGIGSTTYYVTQAVNGCEGPPAEITVVITPDYVEIDYPKFFSPNGDSMRDTWNIFTPEHGVKAIVEIYDRYGKIITVLKAPGAGWDGTYNGRNLPATDYWFKAVYKEYGIEKEFKAHFSLLR